MKLKTALRNLQKDNPILERPELALAVHWKPAANLPIHRWFKYREGFSPYLFNYLPDSNRRLDPFCGCGTTLLESATRGVCSYGIDLNPLATFVAKVKTKKYSQSEKAAFSGLYCKAAQSINSCSPAAKPDYELLDKLFLPQSLDALLRLKTFIDNIQPQKIRHILLLAWLSILEDSSNAYKEGNGLKYRNKRRNPGQYETIPDSEWIPRYFGSNIREFVINLWKTKCQDIVYDLSSIEHTKTRTPRIRTGSCLEEKTIDFGTEFDLVVFSPPYANRFDYFETFKVELWMGGFVSQQKDMLRLRARSMRNNLAARRFTIDNGWPPLEPFLEIMDPSASSVRMGIQNTIRGYFHDMRTLLKNLKPRLDKGGQVVIVVGNSSYAKSIIPTDILIATIAREVGYKVKNILVARHLHVSSQQRSSLEGLKEFMRESVVILSK